MLSATSLPPAPDPRLTLHLVSSENTVHSVDIDVLTHRFAGSSLAEAALLAQEEPVSRLSLPDVPERGVIWLAGVVAGSHAARSAPSRPCPSDARVAPDPPRGRSSAPTPLPTSLALEALAWDEQYLGGAQREELLGAVMDAAADARLVTTLAAVEAQRADAGAVPVERALRRLSFRLADSIVERADSCAEPGDLGTLAAETGTARQVNRAVTAALLRLVGKAPERNHPRLRPLAVALVPGWSTTQFSLYQGAFAGCKALRALPYPWAACSREREALETCAAGLGAAGLGDSWLLPLSEARESQDCLQPSWLRVLRGLARRHDFEGLVQAVAEAPAEARGEPPTWPLALATGDLHLSVGDDDIVRFVLEAAPRQDREACWEGLALGLEYHCLFDLDLIDLVAEASERPHERYLAAAIAAVGIGDADAASRVAPRLRVEDYDALTSGLPRDASPAGVTALIALATHAASGLRERLREAPEIRWGPGHPLESFDSSDDESVGD